MAMTIDGLSDACASVRNKLISSGVDQNKAKELEGKIYDYVLFTVGTQKDKSGNDKLDKDEWFGFVESGRYGGSSKNDTANALNLEKHTEEQDALYNLMSGLDGSDEISLEEMIAQYLYRDAFSKDSKNGVKVDIGGTEYAFDGMGAADETKYAGSAEHMWDMLKDDGKGLKGIYNFFFGDGAEPASEAGDGDEGTAGTDGDGDEGTPAASTPVNVDEIIEAAKNADVYTDELGEFLNENKDAAMNFETWKGKYGNLFNCQEDGKYYNSNGALQAIFKALDTSGNEKLDASELARQFLYIDFARDGVFDGNGNETLEGDEFDTVHDELQYYAYDGDDHSADNDTIQKAIVDKLRGALDKDYDNIFGAAA